jgi:hypothetical protein
MAPAGQFLGAAWLLQGSFLVQHGSLSTAFMLHCRACAMLQGSSIFQSQSLAARWQCELQDSMMRPYGPGALGMHDAHVKICRTFTSKPAAVN